MDEPGLPVAGDFDYLIRSLRRRLVVVIDHAAADMKLPLSAWFPLLVLAHEDGISQRELAKRLHLKDAAMGKAIDGLEREGLLRRADDPGDRRKFLVVLTPRGRKIAADIMSLRARILETLQKGFSGKERDLFKQFLQRAYDNLGGLADPQAEEDPGRGALLFKRSSK